VTNFIFSSRALSSEIFPFNQSNSEPKLFKFGQLKVIDMIPDQLLQATNSIAIYFRTRADSTIKPVNINSKQPGPSIQIIKQTV
jgi:hypothetical protein